MSFVEEIKIKANTKVDSYYKIYIPKKVREVIDIEPKEKLKILIDEDRQAIKLSKKDIGGKRK